MSSTVFDWDRFWCPRGGHILLDLKGFLFDPRSEHGPQVNPHVVSFRQLIDKPCLVLLGEPGIGKTTAINRNRAETEATAREAGEAILWRNLNSYSSDILLTRSIFEDPDFLAWREGNGIFHLFLDSLDECLVRIDALANILAEQLSRCPTERLRLRIACRTASWPSLLEEQLVERWGREGVGIYELAPLRQRDVASAATASGIDASAFLAEVDRREASPLANKPVTLRFLLSTYRSGAGFPARQAELYRQGCERLCEEVSQSRRAARLTGTLTPSQRLHVAARIAALTVFCGRTAIWTGPMVDAPASDLPLEQVLGASERIGDQVIDVTERVVREVLDTGLFTGRETERLGFAHQTYAEFLAAWYLHFRGMDIDQMLSLITLPGDESGMVVPQLQETAAWLGSLVPAVYDRIAERDPQVLLGSDVAMMSSEARERLVGSLLRLFDAQTLIDSQLGMRTRYRKLAHPRLDAQLEPFIRDRTKGTVVRRVAIDIAEACALRSLQTLLADTALDLTEDQHVREQAAAALGRIGDDAAIGRLRPCVIGNVGDDPDDELKGLALRSLWPGQLTDQEVFAALTHPKRSSLLGSYMGFLIGPLLEELSPSSLPIALRWAASQPARDDAEYPFRHLMNRVLSLGWDHLDDRTVLDLFAQTVAKRLENHFEIPGLDGFEQQQATVSDAQRRQVCEALVPFWTGRGAAPALLVYGQTHLLRPSDFAWAVARLQSARSPTAEKFWVEVLKALFRLGQQEQVATLYDAIPNCPALAAEFGALFTPVEIDSPQAGEMRRRYREWEDLEARGREGTQRPLLQPPPQERVAMCLNRFEAGNLNGWWQLNLELTLEPTSTHYGNELESDLTTSPGWAAADDATRQRILSAAWQYLLQGQPAPDGWLGTDTLHRADFSGYRALILLAREQPNLLATLPSERWRAWAAAVVGAPVILGGPGEDLHQEMVRRAYAHAVEEVIPALLTMIDAENRRHQRVIIMRKMDLCWDARLVEALADKVRDPALTPDSTGTLLELLLQHRSYQARAFANSSLALPIPTDELPRRRAVAAAAMLLMHADDGGWETVWPAFTADPAFGGEVISIVADSHTETYAASLTEHLTEEQVGCLYLWLLEHFPPSEDPQHEGACFVGPRESIAMFRDAVLRRLWQRGTVAACRAVDRLAAARPDLTWLRWVAVEARTFMRRQTWVPPRPEAFLRLAADCNLRLVESADQLLFVVVASLRRLERELQGETPAAPDLWDNLGGRQYRPKDESALSDYFVRHLRRDIQRRGIVANREVQIRRGEGKGQGERTDIKIDAIVRGPRPEEYDCVTVTVEVKGCWNRGLLTDMKGQLCGRYLAENQCRHGLYLVGWFVCQQWDAADDRNRQTPHMTIAEAQRVFDDQAAALSIGSRCIRAIILNTGLR